VTRFSDETARKLLRLALREQNHLRPQKRMSLKIALVLFGLAAWTGYAVCVPP
jgi:hypothetical protein